MRYKSEIVHLRLPLENLNRLHGKLSPSMAPTPSFKLLILGVLVKILRSFWVFTRHFSPIFPKFSEYCEQPYSFRWETEIVPALSRIVLSLLFTISNPKRSDTHKGNKQHSTLLTEHNMILSGGHSKGGQGPTWWGTSEERYWHQTPCVWRGLLKGIQPWSNKCSESCRVPSLTRLPRNFSGKEVQKGTR